MKRYIAVFMVTIMVYAITGFSLAEKEKIVLDLEKNDELIQVDEQKMPDLDLSVFVDLETEATDNTETNTTDSASSGNIKINKKNFPDSKFRAYVSERFDSNGDGTLSSKERNAVEDIDVDNMGIYSLVGVEYFPNLDRLFCNNNRLTSLNITKCKLLTALSCENNRLKSLDVSKNVNLESLYCCHHSLKSLKLGRNKSIDNIECYDDSDLRSIDIAGCGDMKKWIECVWDKYQDEEDGKAYYGWFGKEAGLIIDRATKVYSGKKLLYKPGNPKSVAFKKKSITIDAGEPTPLKVTMKPAGVASYCTFTSSDTDIVTVDKHYYYVYGRKEGTATITVKTANGKKAKIKVTVKGNEVW